MSLLCWKNTDAFLEYDSALASVSCCNISVTGRLCIQQTLSQPRIFLQARLQALADNAVRHALSRPKVLSKLLSHQTPHPNQREIFFKQYFWNLHYILKVMCGLLPPNIECTCVLLIWWDDSWWQSVTAVSCPLSCSPPSVLFYVHPPVAHGPQSQEVTHTDTTQHIAGN